MSNRPTCRWRSMVAHLAGEPWPPLPALPGRVHVCRDEPLPDDMLVGITSCTELALVLGISRQTAHARLRKARAALIDADSGACD